MKVRASIKKICKKCKIVKRQRTGKKGGPTKIVICEDRRHNQRQG